MSRPTCYSDHDHDIYSVGACTICGGTDRDGNAPGKRITEVVAQPTLVPEVLPVCREVVAEKSFKTPIINASEVIIDFQTANVVVTVYDALSPKAQAKANTMPFLSFVNVCWKLVSTNA